MSDRSSVGEPIYRHRQYGALPLVFAVLAFALLSTFLFGAGVPGLAALVLFVLFVLFVWLAQFWRLTVTVTREHVRIEFGWGLIHKTIPIDRVRNARPGRNRWYYGWGIRLYPGGWLYNVAGLDALELSLRAGRKVRIGTDEPAELTRALAAALEEPLPSA